MNFHELRRSTLGRRATAVLLVVLAGGAFPVPTASQEPQFLAENKATMAKMMTAMDVPASGDVDRDFVATMVPHHQAAIDMALAELRYGRNEQLRRIAQEIVVDQQQEIAVMRLALSQPLSSSASAPQPAPPLSVGAPDSAAMPMTNMPKAP